MKKQQTEEYIFITEQKKKNNYHQKPSILKHCWKFDDKMDFANWIATSRRNKKNPLPDCISFYAVPFSMEEYDMSGRQVFYANRKLSIQIEVNHANRYKDMASIQDIAFYEAISYRNDITYLE